MSNEFKQGSSSTTPAAVNIQNNPTQGVATPQQKTVGRVQGSTPSGSSVSYFVLTLSEKLVAVKTNPMFQLPFQIQ